MRTSDVKAAIRRHYKATEYALMWEVGNATGANVRRHADAVVMNLWPSRGLLIEGIEIKVSRSDWRRELENPAKAEEIARYCDKWWVVAPIGIVQAHEVPINWGWKEVNANGVLITKKDAVRNENPSELNRSFVAAMLRRASEADAAMVNKLVEAQVSKERDAINDRVEKEVERRTQHFASVEDKFAKLKESGLNLLDRWETADEIIRAYKLGRSLTTNYKLSGLEGTAKMLEDSAATVRSVAEMLAREGDAA